MSRKKVADKKRDLVKMSLQVPAVVQWRLTTLANRLRRDRSEFATELLDQGLARYAFDKALKKLGALEPGEEEPAT